MNLGTLKTHPRIATKLNLVAVLSGLALCGLSVAALHSAKSIGSTAEHIRSQAMVAVVRSAELGVLVERHRRIIEAAPVTFDKIRVDKDRRISEAIADRIQDLVSQDENRFLDPVERQLPQFFKLGRRVLYLAANFAQDEALKNVYDYGRIAKHIQERIVTYRTINLRNADKDTAYLTETVRALVNWVLLAALFAAVLVGPLTIAAVRNIAERIRKITDAMRALSQNKIETPIPMLESTDEIGEMARAVSVFKDNAIALRQKHQEVATLNARVDLALNNMVRGLSMFDTDRKLIVCNTILRDMYGLPQALTTASTPFADIVRFWALQNLSEAEETTESNVDAWLEQHAERIGAGAEFTDIHHLPDGRIYAINTRPLPTGGWVDVHEDITEKQRSAERIAELAQTDTLTGLANRHSFLEELESSFAGCRESHEFAILWIDLDRFKEVNDTQGHPTGDALLKVVADRLKRSVRQTDFVARLGGDEFAVIVRGRDISHEMLANIAARINAVISEPALILDNWVKVGASIGISTAPGDGTASDAIMKTADIALYRAKAEGRGKAIFFNRTMADALSKRRRLQSDLEAAVAESKLELYYQPILSVKQRRVVSFEALMRWRHPQLGYVPPTEFIPLAEETGLISDIGAWAMRTACHTAAAWPNDISVSVNVSAAQFRANTHGSNQSVEQMVKQALTESGLSPSRLQLEVTETLLLHDKSENWEALAKLKTLGIAIALDDFGTGYSSLSYLRRFPFDKIKIDKSFVRDIGQNVDSITIVQAISDLASTLGMACVAEGVETEEHRRFIEIAQCEEMQGFLFSKPVPAELVLQTLSDCEARNVA